MSYRVELAKNAEAELEELYLWVGVTVGILGKHYRELRLRRSEAARDSLRLRARRLAHVEWAS